jgi:beta-mannosidase
MITIPLNQNWQLYHFPQGDKPLASPSELRKTGLIPIPACVPGNVELDLQRAGLLPDPFFGENIRQLRPLETYEWWYIQKVWVPDSFKGQPNQLVFEGLDTLADVWVNDAWIGSGRNMLVEQRFNTTTALRPGEENQIAVRITSPMIEAKRTSYPPGAFSWEQRAEGLHLRKAPHVWGWDILPRAVSAGIWRPCRLETQSEHAIEQIYYWTVDANPAQAVLGVRFQVRLPEALADGYSLRFHGACGEEHSFDFEWPLEFIAGGFSLPVPRPELWWPLGMGPANLYTIQVQLCKEGRVVAQRGDRIGLRKLVVERTDLAGQVWSLEPLSEPGRIDVPPSPESHFLIRVNDQPVMIKGTNWVPLDAFHSRDEERLDQALDMAVDLGCNMLRCWGGNVYESDRFFEQCDQRGLLVWQDFAFACCIYPQTEEFLEQVRGEIIQVTERLRNHPSLALWCGDNEIDMVYTSEERDPGRNRLTRQVIPQVLDEYDPYRHYLPSSPYVPPALVGRSDAWQRTPEQHLWGPRGYYKSPFYTRHSAHFISEIGYHGCPNVASLQRFLSPQALWPWQDNPEWQTHSVYHWRHSATQRDRIQLMANQIRELFGHIPEDLEHFALASQITQAEAKKFFIENTRLRKWATSGILWWNLLDGWPQFSDAVVDYYFGKKLAYHYIQRVQQPVCVLLGEAGTGKYLPVAVCNDSLQDAEVVYRVWDAESGETVLEGKVQVPANQNWQVERLRTFAGEQRLYLIEWQLDGKSFGNHALVGPPPFDLEQYRQWLSAIAALPRSFEADQVAR